jgi:hypothetical protein
MKLPVFAGLAYSHAVVRSWLRHTWISRIPLWNTVRASWRDICVARQQRRRTRNIRLSLELLENRELLDAASNALVPPLS